MSLAIDTLKLVTWRNVTFNKVTFSPSLTILVGPNAVGKTNTIEALQLLTAGFSFRKPRSAALIQDGGNSARAELLLTGDKRVIELECKVSPQGRKFTKNNKTIRASELPKLHMSVLFNPDDLGLIKQSASARRDEIDNFGKQVNESYYRVLKAYTKSVEQRNNLLKEEFLPEDLLDAWDVSLARGAATLLQYRLRLLEHLYPYMQKIYSEIAPHEQLEVTYDLSLPALSAQDVLQMSKDELQNTIYGALQKSHAQDIRRGQTQLGPHRDDLVFYINGRNAREFASQGQQRSCVLAWKMAEVLTAEKIRGERPLLLLDDVMSELDKTRRAAMTNFISTHTQTVLTTTNLDYFEGLSKMSEVKIHQINPKGGDC